MSQLAHTTPDTTKPPRKHLSTSRRGTDISGRRADCHQSTWNRAGTGQSRTKEAMVFPTMGRKNLRYWSAAGTAQHRSNAMHKNGS